LYICETKQISMQTKNSYEQVVLNLPKEKNGWKDLSDNEIDKLLEPLTLDEKLRVLKNYSPLNQWRYTEYLYRKYKAELLQSYMNARVTYFGALGHYKSGQNDFYCQKYKSQMSEFQIPVPEDSITLILGVFNGEGSY
jgi:hypothetical protein